MIEKKLILAMSAHGLNAFKVRPWVAGNDATVNNVNTQTYLCLYGFVFLEWQKTAILTI